MPHLWGQLNPYPQPRRRNGADGADAGDALAALRPPRSRIWQGFAFLGAANVRSTAISPRFIGPAILRAFSGTVLLGAVSTTIPGLHLVYSADDSGQASGVARSPLPSGSSIIEATGDVTREGQLFSGGTWRPFNAFVAANNLHFDTDLHFLVPLPEFFLKMTVFSASAVINHEFGFSLVVLEDVDPELVPDLL